MTHRTVTRTLVVFAGTLSTVAVAFGCLVNRPPATPAGAASRPHPGEALFASYCTGCHTVDEAVRFARAAPDVAAARRDLVALLSSHGDSSPDEDAAIVEFVLSKR